MKRTITRPATGTETLELEPCPICKADAAVVRDSGYGERNPGNVTCEPEHGGCGRVWAWRSVKNQWHVGELWNKRAKQIKADLLALDLVELIGDDTEPDRQRAEELLNHLRETVIFAERAG